MFFDIISASEWNIIVNLQRLFVHGFKLKVLKT